RGIIDGLKLMELDNASTVQGYTIFHSRLDGSFAQGTLVTLCTTTIPARLRLGYTNNSEYPPSYIFGLIFLLCTHHMSGYSPLSFFQIHFLARGFQGIYPAQVRYLIKHSVWPVKAPWKSCPIHSNKIIGSVLLRTTITRLPGQESESYTDA
ncbi:hypothetical protein COCCADRAFT_94987, partial [Bipolaris zeicola 26-R-13]